MTTAKTLDQALAVIRNAPESVLARACELHGLPVGGWGQTAQAIDRLVDALPLRAERDYTHSDLIDALYSVDSAGRYVRRGL